MTFIQFCPYRDSHLSPLFYVVFRFSHLDSLISNHVIIIFVAVHQQNEREREMVATMMMTENDMKSPL